MKQKRSGPRWRASGRAYWSAGRRDGAAAIRDVSAGGARVESAASAMRVGDRLRVTLQVGGRLSPSVYAQVVWLGHGRQAGLRFESQSHELSDALRELVAADRGELAELITGGRS